MIELFAKPATKLSCFIRFRAVLKDDLTCLCYIHCDMPTQYWFKYTHNWFISGKWFCYTANMSNCVWLASAAITVKLNDKSKKRFSARKKNQTLKIETNQKRLLRQILKRSIQWNSLRRRIVHQHFEYSTSTKSIHWVPVFFLVTMTNQNHRIHITSHVFCLTATHDSPISQ